MAYHLLPQRQEGRGPGGGKPLTPWRQEVEGAGRSQGGRGPLQATPLVVMSSDQAISTHQATPPP